MWTFSTIQILVCKKEPNPIYSVQIPSRYVLFSEQNWSEYSIFHGQNDNCTHHTYDAWARACCYAHCTEPILLMEYGICNRIKVCTNKCKYVYNEENCADWKTEKTYNIYGVFPLLCDQNFGGLVESPSPPPIISFVSGFFSHVYDLLAMPYLRDSKWIGKNSGDGICLFLYECVKRCAFSDILSWTFILCISVKKWIETCEILFNRQTISREESLQYSNIPGRRRCVWVREENTFTLRSLINTNYLAKDVMNCSIRLDE